MRPLNRYKSRIRKGTKNKLDKTKKLNSATAKAVSGLELKKNKSKLGKLKSQQKIKTLESVNVQSLTEINSYRNAIAELSNKALNDSDNCDSYIEPLLSIIHKKGGGSDETKSIASDLAIKSTGLLLSRLSTTGIDEESTKTRHLLDKFSKILMGRLANDPVLVGLLVAKIVASDFRISNDAMLSLCLTCCNKNTYKLKSAASIRAITENLDVIKGIFQFGSMNDCVRVVKMVNASHKHSFNPKLVSLIPLINLRNREFEANAYFQFQFNQVSKTVKEKLRYSAVTETPDVIVKCKKIVLEQVFSLYFKILKSTLKTNSSTSNASNEATNEKFLTREEPLTRENKSHHSELCDLLTTCFSDLCNFIHHLNLEIQRDVLKELMRYQGAQMCPLARLTSLDCAMKIMKYSESSAIATDVSWIIESMIENIDLVDLPLGPPKLTTANEDLTESNPCKDGLLKTLSVVMDHLTYFINISCDIQLLSQLLSKLLCFAMLCDTNNAKILLTIVFNMAKKYPLLNDLFSHEGLKSSMEESNSCTWHTAALGCHFASEIREFVTEQLAHCKKFTHNF